MYCQQSDIALSNADLISLTNDNGNGDIGQTVISDAITRATRLIDSYLRGRYVTPFDPVPDEVREICATITKHMLYQRRMDTPPEGIRTEYKDAIAWLKDLQVGRAALNEEGQSVDLDRSPGRIVTNKTPADRMFPKSLLNQY